MVKLWDFKKEQSTVVQLKYSISSYIEDLAFVVFQCIMPFKIKLTHSAVVFVEGFIKSL